MTISFKISENTKEKMIEYFQDKKRPKTPPYAIFQADEADTVITLYESGKVVFQGISADIDAAMWKQMEQHLNPGKTIDEKNSDKKDKQDKKEEYIDPKIYQANSIGSDEVGTGDYFGPIVVTAAYVNKENISFLEEIGVKDSKKITDEKILEIAPQIVKKIDYESIILNNKDYNKNYSSDINMNKIKAILHNKVLINMKNKNLNYEYIIVDEFAKPFTYFNYLKDVPNIVRNITFITKAESKTLSVACASIISRYIFLKEIEKLSKKFEIEIPKGAGTKVDEVGITLVEKYGFDILKDVAKYNFKNTDKIKSKLN